MRYIRNVDADLKIAVVQTHDMDGIVEVLGGLGVDGEYTVGAKVPARFVLLLGDLPGNRGKALRAPSEKASVAELSVSLSKAWVSASTLPMTPISSTRAPKGWREDVIGQRLMQATKRRLLKLS